ncbi:Spy/CpxP family protein refolding chaperone [Desertibaculum subflavum]|uniref:Spy/CpxP family protein refolding chaperone n=1 Tax=Desertibaculum subflavum TaxID=2268458 RepID=UPI0013C461B8
MSSRRPLYAAALAGAVLVSGAIGFAVAQPASPAPPPAMGQGMQGQGMQGPHGHGHHQRAAFQPGRHIEGRIAFLKTELKITEAQTPAFNAFADVLRAQAKAMGERHQQMGGDRDKPANAVERLERRTEMMKQGAEASQKLLDAAKPLYAQLSDEQKAAADELLSRGGGKHRMMMRH